jgi:hypothetical protein
MAEGYSNTMLCSVESLQHNEPLTGTAPRADAWFLLEYPGRWGSKALKESSIPDAVKAHLNTQLGLIPESRLLLIKKTRVDHRRISFFAALPGAEPPVLYHFKLEDYAELLGFDLPAIIAQNPRFDPNRSSEPVFVMCTNGLRDQCCALHGVATYWALREKFGELVWQSTHHGGHRFAANFLHLPNGLSYGRLRPESAGAVLQSALNGQVAMDHFRGRTIYPEPVQAGEALLRSELGLDSMNSLKLVSSEQLAGNQWNLRFAENGLIHELSLKVEESPERIHISCGDEKTSPIMDYYVIEHRIDQKA